MRTLPGSVAQKKGGEGPAAGRAGEHVAQEVPEPGSLGSSFSVTRQA